MNLHLYVYNNYYNRTIKSFGVLEDLDEFEVFVEQNTNFNPNDGITTEHIIGGPLMYSGGADYCVVEQNNDIISRWFVLENQRTRGGQYRVILKRDSIADYAAEVFSAPCFVEKGWVSDTDSAIFNKEDMTFNQIKKSEVLLQDTTHVPWLIGYYTKQDEALTANIPKLEPVADYNINGIENWIYYDRQTTPIKYASSYNLEMKFQPSDIPSGWTALLEYTDLTASGIKLDIAKLENYSASGLHYTIDTDSALWGLLGKSIDQNVINALTDNLTANAATLFGYADDYFADYSTLTAYQAVEDTIGRTIYDTADGKYYKVKGIAKSGLKGTERAQVPLTSSFGYQMYNIYSASQTSTGGITGARPTSNTTKTDIMLSIGNYWELQLDLEEVSYGTVNVNVLPTANGKTRNSPYNIFAIPYGTIRVVDENTNVYTDAEIAIRAAMALIEKYSGASGVLHDVQLLPYCPIPEVRNAAAGSKPPRLILSNVPEYLYQKMTDEDNATVGYVFHCVSTSTEFSIKRLIDIKDYKISNETEFCRLVSPNWNGIYEFSPAKNRGLRQIDIDMELKPFTPYIHLAPQFNKDGLYGNRDNDPIGLICGGDFGLTMISDAWAAYERQNKNYQNIFDRQIQNLEIQQKYGRIQDIATMATGTLQGAATTGAMGLMIGGGVGLGIGAGAGALASGIAGAADLYINEQLRQENIDYTKDQFGYQLGNIRALPDSLTKVNSFNPNNTIFPILEFYGATDEEVEALRNKIKYNGMTIGRIGTLNQFINPAEETYVKGQIIKLDIPEDSHFISDIANEIYKGVRV